MSALTLGKKKNLLAQNLLPINFNKNRFAVNFMFHFITQFSGSELNDQLENWLSKAELSYGPARGIIAVNFASL